MVDDVPNFAGQIPVCDQLKNMMVHMGSQAGCKLHEGKRLALTVNLNELLAVGTVLLCYPNVNCCTRSRINTARTLWMLPEPLPMSCSAVEISSSEQQGGPRLRSVPFGILEKSDKVILHNGVLSQMLTASSRQNKGSWRPFCTLVNAQSKSVEEWCWGPGLKGWKS